jgi:hypothetical protein
MRMPSISIDVLHLILEHADKASLVKMCLLNKVCYSCSRAILYRDIRVNGKHHFYSTKVFETLNKSPHLAKRVRSFEITNRNDVDRSRDEQELRKSLQNMICLRSLRLDDGPIFTILDGCTFKLDSFSNDGFHSEKQLHQFLCSQPSLTDVTIGTFNVRDVPWGPCLPNLTRVATHFFRLPHIIPNRPVNQVILYGSKLHNGSVDLSLFTLSTAPIQKLAIDYSYLYSAPLPLLASIFPSLTHLNLKLFPQFGRERVSEPILFIHQ